MCRKRCCISHVKELLRLGIAFAYEVDQTQSSTVWPHPDQGDHHVPVRWPQHQGVQGAGNNQNYEQDWVKNQEVDGQ